MRRRYPSKGKHMTQDEIIEMARQAGVWTEEDDWFKDTEFEDNWNPKIEAFAKLIEEKERSACAKVCESLPMQQEIDVRDQCAAAIRARGDKHD